jgi:hypothetical protein
MGINAADPTRRDQVMLSVRAVVLRELDRAALDPIDPPQLVAAGAQDVHVLTDIRDRPGLAARAERLLGFVLDLLGRLLDSVSGLMGFFLRPVGGLLDLLSDLVSDLRRRLGDLVAGFLDLVFKRGNPRPEK